MENGNTRTVFVVQIDNSKDLSDARRYGRLQAVFGRPRKPYDTTALMRRAQAVLAGWQPGDYLLMVGDPALCAVCMTVVAERDDVINVLSWNRDTFEYVSQTWDFTPSDPELDDFTMAED